MEELMRTGSLRDEAWGAGGMGHLALQGPEAGLGLGLAGEGALRLPAGLELGQWVPPAPPLTGHTSLGKCQALCTLCSPGKQRAQKPFHRATVSVGDRGLEGWGGPGASDPPQ